jgi:23S rRNA (cytosine1962-C5)-methyltransferase
VLGKNLARSIRRGHPWIFRDAIRDAPALSDGALVTVAAPDGQPLALGFWDARSAIAVRVLAAGAPRGAAADAGAIVDARVTAALERRLAFIDRRHTNAFRLLHGEADALPGVHADLYGQAISIRFDGDGARAFYLDQVALPALLAAIAERRALAVTSVIERKRGGRERKRGGRERKPGADDIAQALVGTLPAGEVEVLENDLRFGVDLGRGQKGGLFLDQRDNRAHVRTLARGRRVLNLFGYTGGFSIYAAAGGATHTTTVDVAREAVQAAQRNFQRNQLPLEAAELHAVDAFEFLEKAAGAAAAGDRFSYDLVISDPPSFAPSRKALPAALRAYRRLHQLCATVTAPGGILCAASCSSHVDSDAFLRTVAEGAAAAGRRWVLDELRGAAADHPVAPQFPEGNYLKFAVGRL